MPALHKVGPSQQEEAPPPQAVAGSLSIYCSLNNAKLPAHIPAESAQGGNTAVHAAQRRGSHCLLQREWKLRMPCKG